MKRLFNQTVIAGILLMGIALASCSKDPQSNTLPGTPNVTISVVSVTENSATIGFEVTNGTSYNCALGQDSDISDFAKGTLEGIKTQIPVSQKEVTFDNLSSDKEYTIFVQVNADNYTGGVKTQKFTTLESSNPDLAISINTVYAGENFISFSVSYGEDTRSISYAVGQPEDAEAFANGTIANIKTVEVPLSSMIDVSDLESGKEYTVFVRANSASSQGEVISFTEKTVLIKFDIDVKSRSKGATITFTPGGDVEGYYFIVNLPDQLDQYTGMFGMGIMNEIFVTDVSRPYTYDFSIESLDYFLANWTIYYVIDTSRNMSTNIRTYDFSVLP